MKLRAGGVIDLQAPPGFSSTRVQTIDTPPHVDRQLEASKLMCTNGRRSLLVALLAGTCLRFAPANAMDALVPWSGPEDAPPIDLLRTDGSPFTLRELRGKVVLVNFWATWCEPCIAEMPSLQRLREHIGAERFEVLGVNHKEGPARIDAFVGRVRITFPVVRDTDGAVARAWGARVFPSSYVVDGRGRVRYLLAGEADWTNPAIVSKISALLGPPPQR